MMTTTEVEAAKASGGEILWLLQDKEGRYWIPIFGRNCFEIVDRVECVNEDIINHYENFDLVEREGCK